MINLEVHKGCVSAWILAAQFLGFDEFIPPFANLTRKDILKGVNYASASSGIRDETGTQAVYERSTNFTMFCPWYLCVYVGNGK